jgi:hypothetical protein
MFWVLNLVTLGLSLVEPAIAGPAAPAVAAESPRSRSPVSSVHAVGTEAVLSVAVVIPVRLVAGAPILLVGGGSRRPVPELFVTTLRPSSS